MIIPLTYFDGGSNLVPVLPSPGPGHSAWQKGTIEDIDASAMAIDILENADMEVFVGQGGAVHCQVDQLRAHAGNRQRRRVDQQLYDHTVDWSDGSQTLFSFALPAPRCGALQPAAAACSSDRWF